MNIAFTFLFAICLSLSPILGGTPQDLPKALLGEYSGKFEHSQNAAGKSNTKKAKIEDVIVLGLKKSVKWNMADPHTGRITIFSGTYSILSEHDQNYSLLCTVTSKSGNTSMTGKFYVSVPKNGDDITYTDMSKMHSYKLKKK